MRNCPNGHEVSDDLKFCPQCGAEIQEKIAKDVRFCKKCGNERKGAEKFCSHCGTPFNGDSSQISVFSSTATKEIIQGYSINKKTLYLLILVPVILLLGYFVNNHIQEEKRLEKERIEANERAAEEERKRIEEENKPANKFYNIAKTNEYVWEGEGPWSKYYPWISGGRGILFFYPFNNGGGRVSFVRYSEMGLLSGSGTGVYSANDANITFTIKSKLYGYYDIDIDFNMQIVNDGNSIKLIRWDEGAKREQRYYQIKKPRNDPFNK